MCGVVCFFGGGGSPTYCGPQRQRNGTALRQPNGMLLPKPLTRSGLISTYTRPRARPLAARLCLRALHPIAPPQKNRQPLPPPRHTRPCPSHTQPASTQFRKIVDTKGDDLGFVTFVEELAKLSASEY